LDGGEVLPDVLAKDLKVVFCGSAAGRRSAEVGAYYAGPGNRFWALLYRLDLTPRLLRPEEFRHVLAWGIGLTDLAKEVSGSDALLPKGSDQPEALRRRILAAKPQVLAFNGKRPGRAFLGRQADYGLQVETIGQTRIFVLPSTSRANAHFNDAAWLDLGRYLGSLQ
jgi:TDG/mug DNA glycosylase family protein